MPAVVNNSTHRGAIENGSGSTVMQRSPFRIAAAVLLPEARFRNVRCESCGL